MPAKQFPKWLQELRRFQFLKSQFYLYGNIYDCYYFPVNYHQVTSSEDLKWAKFNDLKLLLTRYLKNEGYELILYYDVIDGFELETTDSELTKDFLLKWVGEQNPAAKAYFGQTALKKVASNLSDTLSLFRSRLRRYHYYSMIKFFRCYFGKCRSFRRRRKSCLNSKMPISVGETEKT